MDNEPTNRSLEQVLGVMRRRAPWILLCILVTAGAAYGFSKRQTKKYTAAASLVFNNNQPSQQVAGLPVVSSNSPQAQQNTNVKLVQLGDMAERTGGLLGQVLGGWGYGAIYRDSAQPRFTVGSTGTTIADHTAHSVAIRPQPASAS
jgi:Chain length determinant protein